MRKRFRMNKNITFFDYSKLAKYKSCPLSYKWTYIDNKVPKTPPNMYYAFPGIVIQKIFEYFYNREWFLKRGACREFMYEKASEIFEKTLKYCNVDWYASISKKSKSKVYEDILEMIGKGLDTIKRNKLLGKLAKSEYKIQTYFEDNKYVVLTSKIDFLIKNKDGLQILDGKATSNKANYLKDPTQLLFYAMIFKIKFKRYPDKIGYWFWRDGTISYVDIDEEKIEDLKKEIKEVLYKIYKKKFEPTPNYKACLFCNYQGECLARKKDIAEKQAEKVGKVTEEDLNSFLI